jgi:hypothetical protein
MRVERLQHPAYRSPGQPVKIDLARVIIFGNQHGAREIVCELSPGGGLVFTRLLWALRSLRASEGKRHPERHHQQQAPAL